MNKPDVGKGTVCAGPELLEILAWKSGLEFISDLKFLDSGYGQVLHTLRGIQPEQYPLKEWNDAVHYLTGNETPFESAGEAKKFLLERWGGTCG